jgi:catechol 2,3-dioxygenase-like lactoylglutathione lyase family enzyme
MLRRSFLSLLVTAGALCAADAKPRISAVDSIGLTVADLDRSVEFYTSVLSFEKVSQYEAAGDAYEHLTGVFGARMRVARMRLGDEHIELTEYLAPSGRRAPEDARNNDRWFQHIAIIVSNMDRAYARLRQHRVQHASSGPQRLPEWNRNAAGIEAFYFRDPDGHPLEILAFPPDKGAAKWHGTTDRLFLGIDHTAIVVSDTEASLRFYRDTLGMHIVSESENIVSESENIVSESENYGTEQEHLNNVFGARLRITSLRTEEAPGVEFLEYLSPRDGRPYPIDEHSNDLLHLQTRFVGSAGAAVLISHAALDLPDGGSGFRKAVLVRDPDGHAVEIVEP